MTDQSTAGQPAYVFVGGICHTPDLFDPLIAEMRKYSITSTAVRYPTVGDDTEGKTQQDEIKAIQESVLSFLDGQNKDVVLVCHSYGGWPGSRAVKGLDKETRLAHGATTGILELVFVAAFIVPDNAPSEQLSQSPPWLTRQGSVGVMNEMVKPALMHDLSAQDQDYWFSRFKPHRIELPKGTCPDAPWHLSLPKTYIIPTGELPLSIEFQTTWLKSVLDQTWAIKSIRAAHEPFLSKPAELAQVLLTETF